MIKLKEVKSELQKKTKLAAIGQMSSYIAHDLRSPIQVLRNYLNTIPNSEDPDEIDFQNAAKNSVNKLSDMANELVDYSKATKLQKNNVSINDLITETVINEIEKSASKKNVNINTSIQDSIIANVDSQKISRVLINIINNGIQAIDKQDGIINLKVCLNS